MNNLYLKIMGQKDKESVLNFIKEMVMFGSQMDGIWYTDEENFESMLAKINDHSQAEFINYEQSFPVKHQYLLKRVEDHHLVGLVSIRPFLTKSLDESFGGNIGYSIRPTERRKGYGTEGLRLALVEFKKHNNLDSVMVCCNSDNLGSKKAIIKNGGYLIEVKHGIISKEKYLID